MDNPTLIIVLITLTLAAVFLFVWQRRDKGIVPEDRLADALHEPLNGRQGF